MNNLLAIGRRMRESQRMARAVLPVTDEQMSNWCRHYALRECERCTKPATVMTREWRNYGRGVVLCFTHWLDWKLDPDGKERPFGWLPLGKAATNETR